MALVTSMSGLGPARGRSSCEPAIEADEHADEVREERPEPAVWTSRATRVLGSDHYSFRAAVRRIAPAHPAQAAEGACPSNELVIANGYDHVPQYLARIAMQRGRTCGPERVPQRWSARALHHADIAVADFDHDGRDELVVASFAAADGRMHAGQVTIVSGVGVEATLASGVAAASLAVGDVDADGDLDVVVGTITSTPAGQVGRDIKHVHGDELDGPTWVLHGPDFESRDALPGVGALDVHLADVDLDGALDVIAAGPAVTIAFGPAPWDVVELALPNERGQAVTPAVDVAWSPDRSRALVVATSGCMAGDECVARLGDMGVVVWRVDTARGGTPRAAELAAWWLIEGVPGPARFVFVDDDDVVDVIAGVMTEPVAPDARPIVGRPWLGPAGVVGGAPRIRRGLASADGLVFLDAWEPLAITTPSPAYPMATAIVPWADPRTATTITTREDGRAVVTWTGRGEVAGAAAHTDDGRELALDHVPGDAHVFLRDATQGPITVRWQVAMRPQLIITSSCPLAGEAAGTLFVEPPHRVRAAHVINEEK